MPLAINLSLFIFEDNKVVRETVLSVRAFAYANEDLSANPKYPHLKKNQKLDICAYPYNLSIEELETGRFLELTQPN